LRFEAQEPTGVVMKTLRFFCTAIAILIFLANGAAAGDRLKLSSTTSTDNTGLLAYLLPEFEARTGIKVDVIAVGTGKALKLAENGDVDVTLVHAPFAEKAFIEAGYGVDHRTVMANYFAIVGPEKDPAGIAEAASAEEAFRKIAGSGSPFVSRGDNSGTHIKEQDIWRTVLGHIPEGRSWYLESGKGMGETLIIADEKLGYTLSDSGTYLKYSDKVDLKMLFVKSSDLLYNPYGIMAVNPEKHRHANYEGARKLIDWIISDEGQGLIGEFTDKYGNKLFIPLAGKET
jgi:tungstate transport system substrate-binding protein